MPAAKQIKIALIENDMQQKDLANILQVSTAAICKMLKNDNIGYNKVEEIADILGYEIVWKKKAENIQQTQNVNNNSGFIGSITQNNN